MEERMQEIGETSHLPQRLHTYQDYHKDSSHWDGFKPRTDDIIIATTPKAGTTWVQAIVANLIFQDQEIPAPLWQMSPWLDRGWGQIEEMLSLLEAQTHRRFIKTHLPLDGLIFYPAAKYIYVGRDGRDCFMSYWNHYRAFKPESFDAINDAHGGASEPFRPPPEDIHDFYRDWIAKVSFSRESDRYHPWSVLYHVKTWWEYRHLPNILLVHFNDLLYDLEGQIRTIARYLDIEVDEAILPTVVDNCTFKSMKRDAENFAPAGGSGFIGGAQRFIHKGTNGRWKGVLSAGEIALYEKAVSKILSADCARWLEQGQTAPS
jgi:aryl sulfotransferase